jgi:putative hemolysin
MVSLIIILILLAGSAMTSGAEVAFFSLSPKEMEKIKSVSARSHKLVSKLIDHPRHLLATILVANNIINILIIILSSLQLSTLFDKIHHPVLVFWINVVIITFLLVLFGEVMPKIYAASNNIKMALLLVQPINFLGRILYPLSHLMVISTNFLDQRIVTTAKLTTEDFDYAIDIATDKQSNKQEVNLLKGIIKFGNIAVKQIMRPRLDIVAAKEDMNFEEVLKFVKDAGYSRFPIIKDDFDHVIGFLYTKELLPFLNYDKFFKWKSLMHKPFFVPETRKIDDLLRDFQARMTHMAIVVNEYGGTSGLITLEDIVEEIVGDISDEFDEKAEAAYKKINDTTFEFDGKMPLIDASRILHISPDTFDEVRGDSDSIAGLFLELSGKIPTVNEELGYKNFRLVASGMDSHRVSKVKIVVLPEENKEEQHAKSAP